MSTSITPSITDGQKTQYSRMVEDAAKHGIKLALDKIEADSAGWQRVLENGDELKTAIAEVIVSKTRELLTPNQFASEGVKSTYGYPKGYAVKPIRQQCDMLAHAFPGLSLGLTIEFLEYGFPKFALPAGAEDWFAVPRWQKIAPTYGEAVEKMLAVIASARRFTNYREGHLGPEYLRQHAHTAHALYLIGEQQPGDILIIPSQFGLRHRGRSVRRAREVMVHPEFGHGAFGVGSMLVTHPERLVKWEQLHVDCPGDEYAPDADGVFSSAPFFDFDDGGRVEFGANWFDFPLENYGSASAFLPQP